MAQNEQKFWEMGKFRKGNYCLISGRFRCSKEKVIGEEVYQLVWSDSRRIKVMGLPHNSIFGGHVGGSEEHWRGRSFHSKG